MHGCTYEYTTNSRRLNISAEDKFMPIGNALALGEVVKHWCCVIGCLFWTSVCTFDVNKSRQLKTVLLLQNSTARQSQIWAPHKNHFER